MPRFPQLQVSPLPQSLPLLPGPRNPHPDGGRRLSALPQMPWGAWSGSSLVRRGTEHGHTSAGEPCGITPRSLSVTCLLGAVALRPAVLVPGPKTASDHEGPAGPVLQHSDQAGWPAASPQTPSRDTQHKPTARGACPLGPSSPAPLGVQRAPGQTEGNAEPHTRASLPPPVSGTFR